MKAVHDKMTLYVYIGVIFEIYVLVLFANCSEILHVKVLNDGRRFSLIFASCSLAVLLAIIIAMMYLWKKSNNAEYLNSMYYFREIYGSQKANKESRLYPIMFFLRRFTLGCLVIFLDPDFGINIKVVSIIGVQVTMVIYILFARPFESQKDNI